MGRPIWVALFPAAVMGRIAPVGQTSEQVTQFTRQKPRSKESDGWSMPVPSAVLLRT